MQMLTFLYNASSKNLMEENLQSVKYSTAN